jgi:hypothetical protein
VETCRKAPASDAHDDAAKRNDATVRQSAGTIDLDPVVEAALVESLVEPADAIVAAPDLGP